MSSYNTYQNAPAIRMLDQPSPQRYFGDSTVLPNTGLTNGYDDALFGLALNQLLDRLRVSIIVSSLLVLIITFFTWWTHVLQPLYVFLSLLLGCMAFVLLVMELSTLWGSAGDSSASSASSESEELNDGNRALLKKILVKTQYVGNLCLRHPIGKTAYMVACGSLCWQIGGTVEAFLGIVFWLNTGIVVYCWITYPEYRQSFQNATTGAENTADVENAQNPQQPSLSSPWSTIVPSERVSLVGTTLLEAF